MATSPLAMRSPIRSLPPFPGRGVLLSAVAMVLFMTSSCGSTGATSTATPTVSATPRPAAIVDQLITKAPAGFVQAPEPGQDTGPADLPRAIQLDGKPDARAALTTLGFQAGYLREWAKGADKSSIVLIVIQLSNHDNAVALVARAQTPAAGDPSLAAAPTHFAVPEIPGAVGTQVPTLTGSGYEVTFATGPYAVVLAVSGPSVTEGTVDSLAQAQFALL